MSLPEVEFDWAKVDTMLMAGCTCEEIAGEYGCCRNTVIRAVDRKFGVTYVEYARSKRSKGDGRLRMQQYLKAIGATNKGNDRQLEILGKHRLGQIDTKEITSNKEDLLNKVFDFIDKEYKKNDDQSKANPEHSGSE